MLIKAHIDSNRRNLYLLFLPQLLCDPSPSSARKERNLWANHVILAPEADISIHGYGSPSHACKIKRRCRASELSTVPFDVVHPKSTRSMRSISHSKTPSHLSRSSLFVLLYGGGAKWNFLLTGEDATCSSCSFIMIASVMHAPSFQVRPVPPFTTNGDVTLATVQQFTHFFFFSLFKKTRNDKSLTQFLLDDGSTTPGHLDNQNLGPMS